MALDISALLAEVTRDTTLTEGVIAFLEGFPPQATINDVVAAIKANNDRVEAALGANVPPDVEPTE